ncbi:hypothetical protein U1Q18_001144, partial [Sarracenia purpurea var. burkii]
MNLDLKVFDKKSQPNSKVKSKDLAVDREQHGGSMLSSTQGEYNPSHEINGKFSKDASNHAQSRFEEHIRGSVVGQS